MSSLAVVGGMLQAVIPKLFCLMFAERSEEARPEPGGVRGPAGGGRPAPAGGQDAGESEPQTPPTRGEESQSVCSPKVRFHPNVPAEKQEVIMMHRVILFGNLWLFLSKTSQ